MGYVEFHGEGLARLQGPSRPLLPGTEGNFPLEDNYMGLDRHLFRAIQIEPAPEPPDSSPQVGIHRGRQILTSTIVVVTSSFVWPWGYLSYRRETWI